MGGTLSEPLSNKVPPRHAGLCTGHASARLSLGTLDSGAVFLKLESKAKGRLRSYKRPPAPITVWQGGRSGDGRSVGGVGLGLAEATDRTSLTPSRGTGGKGPADLGGAQWVGLGSGREGSSARAASGRGGRDHTKGGAAAVLPGVGGPSPLLPYLQSAAPHALRRLQIDPQIRFLRRAISLCPSQKRAGARGRVSGMLADKLRASQLIPKCICPSRPIPLMETEARGLLAPLGRSPFLSHPYASAQCQVDQGLVQRRLQLLISTTIQKVRHGAPRCPLNLAPHQHHHPLPGQLVRNPGTPAYGSPTNWPLPYHSRWLLDQQTGLSPCCPSKFRLPDSEY